MMDISTIMYVVFVLVVLVLLWRQLLKLRISNLDNRYVFITGCDSGFGYLLAKRLDSLGLHVFAGCLTKSGGEGLKKVTSARVTVVPIDVTKSESITKALEEVKRHLPDGKGLWALVNNAGLFGDSCYVAADWLNLDDYKLVMKVNLYGVVEVTKAFVNLVRKERGRIVNITSVSGRVAIGGAPYVCSKYAAEGYADTLRVELWKSGVSVHIIEPAGYRTNFCSGPNIISNIWKRYGELDEERKTYYGEKFVKTLTTTLDFDGNMSSNLNEVIDAYTHALTATFPKTRYVVGWDANLLYRFLWTIPGWLSAFILSFSWPTPQGAKHRKK